MPDPPRDPASSARVLRCGAAYTDIPDPARAIDGAVEQVCAQTEQAPGCLVAMVSPDHAATLIHTARTISERVPQALVIAVRAPGVCAGHRSSDGHAGLALLAIELGSAGRAHVLREPISGHAAAARSSRADPRSLASLARPSPGVVGAFLWCDPKRLAVSALLEQIALDADDPWTTPLIGGLATSAPTDEISAVIVDPEAAPPNGIAPPEPVSGAALVFSGDIQLAPLLSQGCLAFGPSLRVTKARRNLILELEGQSALRVVAACADRSVEDLMGEEVLLGRVVGSPGRRPGRGDYEIAPIVRFDEGLGGLGTRIPFSVGDVVRLHRPDSGTALSDLELLLDAQKLHGPPAGILLAGPHDWSAGSAPSAAFARAFEPTTPGEERARAGRAIGAEHATVPVAGVMTDGQIGLLGGRPRLTRHSVAALVVRASAAQAPS